MKTLQARTFNVFTIWREKGKCFNSYWL